MGRTAAFTASVALLAVGALLNTGCTGKARAQPPPAGSAPASGTESASAGHPGSSGTTSPIPSLGAASHGASCAASLEGAAAGTGAGSVAAPALRYVLADRWQEAWLGSPSVADLDRDGHPEIVVPRHDQLLVWRVKEGAAPVKVWQAPLPGRIWSSPVVADLVPSRPGLEVAVAARSAVVVFDAQGTPLPGFPFTWRDELRSLAAGDIDGDGALELVTVTTTPLSAADGQQDIVLALELDGSVLPGFPPNTLGTAGCDASCVVVGGYDQNVALGDLNGDGRADIVATQDNAYLSVHDGTGRAFDAAPLYERRTKKFPGIRWMMDYRQAQQGFAEAEDTDNQAHFTNSAPAIADLDGDGTGELVVLGSVQNAAQTDRERGVALWVSRADGTRPESWQTPPHFPGFLSGLWDPGDNLVGLTQQVSVADLDPSRQGPELLFAGYDGNIHAVDARGEKLWSHPYTTSAFSWTAGVTVGDLSGDGRPEVVFNTYGPSGGELIVLDAGGQRLHTVPLGGRGAMPVPTLADVDADGDVDIVVSLKDGVDGERQVLVFEMAGSSPGCLLWPTARGNNLRNGWLQP